MGGFLLNGMHGERVCVFLYLMGCLLSDVNVWRDAGRKKERKEDKFLEGGTNSTCALCIMRPYGARCAAGEGSLFPFEGF